MSESYWRSKARPIIAAVIAEHGREHPNIRRLISEQYPFGERQYHPYKVWLSEMKRQLSGEPVYVTGPKPRPYVPPAGQGEML